MTKLLITEFKKDGKDLTSEFYSYWLLLCALMIWIPTIIMCFAYTLIWFEFRKASKAFPYLSQQSRISRSRKKVIKMLFALIIVELICWGPWQFFTIWQYIITHSNNVPDVRSKGFLFLGMIDFCNYLILIFLFSGSFSIQML